MSDYDTVAKIIRRFFAEGNARPLTERSLECAVEIVDLLSAVRAEGKAGWQPPIAPGPPVRNIAKSRGDGTHVYDAIPAAPLPKERET